MDQARNISELLREADSLGEAAAALTRVFPKLTIQGLLAAERIEVQELGWAPGAEHRDTSYLLCIAALLQPIAEAYGDLPLQQAFRLLTASDGAFAGAIAAALDAPGCDSDGA